jgi:5-methylcytosine-specific restriction endonuclease McrA
MSFSQETVRLVQDRAGRRCEYCLMHQSLQGATFHVEHVLPSTRGGLSVLDNLAWSCPGCNLRKSDRTHALDHESGTEVPLFNSRSERWSEHFRFDGYQVIGQTPVGRATAVALELNHPRRILIRQAEELFGLFSP